MLVSNRLTVTLAQYAQALPDGTVNIIGGGVTLIAPKVPAIWVAGHAQFGWAAIGTQHKLRIELLDDEESPVENDNGPILVELGLGVAPSPHAPFGTTMTVPIAVGFGPPEFQPSSSYQFKLWLDDETHEDWSLGFMTMPEAQSKAA